MRAALGSFALIAVALQLVPAPSISNPPVQHNRTLAANVAVPPAVSALVQRACGNCHSNQTVWPWYAKVAPVSWMIASDVHRARQAMNFSDWPRDSGGGIAALTAACANLQGGRMPPADYRFVHPEARVSAKDAEMFCAWAHSAVSGILAGRKTK